MQGKIFTIAGSDPGGGAGIQADIKTISALGGYAMAAITALTVQNTVKVYQVEPVAGAMVAAQVRAVLEDIPPDAIKVGMLASAEVAKSLAPIFSDEIKCPLVLDPVILSSSGHDLLSKRGVEILKSEIFSHTSLLTPNIPEAEILSGMGKINNIDDMKRIGEKLLSMGPKAVLIKGGHMTGDILTDILVTCQGVFEFSVKVIPTPHTHGTGCTLSSAIATGLGQGMKLPDAVNRAHKYVQMAIRNAPGYGTDNGPLNHFAMLD